MTDQRGVSPCRDATAIYKQSAYLCKTSDAEANIISTTTTTTKMKIMRHIQLDYTINATGCFLTFSGFVFKFLK